MATHVTSKETSIFKENNLLLCFSNQTLQVHKKLIFQILPLILTVLLGGCSIFDEFIQIGPDSVQDSRGEFNQVISDTNDAQSLLNLVKRRYGDSISVLEVSSVSTSIEWQRGGSLALSIFDGGPDANNAGFGGSARYTERPTITYLPLKGGDFIKKVLSPVDVDMLMLLSRSGWRMDRILNLTVNNINGIDNAHTASGPTPAVAPEFKKFDQFLAEMVAIERANLQFGYITNEKKDKQLALYFKKESLQNPNIQNLIKLMNLDGKSNIYPIYAELETEEDRSEIQIDFRSLAGIQFFLSHGIIVPEEHLEEGLVQITKNADGTEFNWSEITGELITIYSSKNEPVQDSAKVFYRSYWFYIKDSDITSKYTFMLLNQIESLQSGEIKESGPTLTLPVN